MKKLVSFIITLVLLIILGAILKEVNFREVYTLITQVNLLYFALAVLVCFLSFLMWNIRWKYIFKGFFKGRFGFMFSVLFSGAFFNTVTPGAGIGGEPFKAYFLSKKYNKPKFKQFLLSFLFFLF